MFFDPATPDVLEAAAEEIRTVGWCQGTEVLSDDGGRVIGYCAIGAINHAAFVKGLSVDGRAYRDAIDALTLHLLGAIVNWNDLPGQTAEDVIDGLLATAKDLRNEAQPS